MNSKKFRYFNICLIAGLILFLQTPASGFISLKHKKINADNFIQLINRASKHVTITGTVCSSEVTDRNKIIFLNFGKNFNTSLSAIIYDYDLHSFIDAGINSPESYFKNKKVKIDGIVRIIDGKPEIIVKSPKQIKIIE